MLIVAVLLVASSRTSESPRFYRACCSCLRHLVLTLLHILSVKTAYDYPEGIWRPHPGVLKTVAMYREQRNRLTDRFAFICIYII